MSLAQVRLFSTSILIEETRKRIDNLGDLITANATEKGIKKRLNDLQKQLKELQADG